MARFGVTSIGRFAAVGLACWLAPARAGAAPLDLNNPTPRTIRVEFEISWNPQTIGQVYSTPVPATYSVTGNTGTVVIAAADHAAAIQTHDLDYFGYLMTWSLVGGSATPFTLHIDRTTLQGTAEPSSYGISITSPLQQLGDVDRVLSTTATAGFSLLPQYPMFPFSCVTCILVAGVPYNPTTGKINAVGADDLDAPDIDLQSFSRAGDLRLSELLAPPAAPALSPFALGSLAIALASLAFLMLRRERAA